MNSFAIQRQRNILSPARHRWLTFGLPWLIILIFSSVRLYMNQTSGLMYDEPITLHIAERVLNGELPYVDFYEHHSPLPWYLLAPFSAISIWRVQRLFVALLGIVALGGLYHLSNRAWGMRAGLIALVLGGLSPLWGHQGNMLIHDSFLLVALVGTIIIWWYAQDKASLIRWVALGIAAGVVVLCKQTGILAAIAIGLGLLLTTRSWKAIAAYIAGGLLTLLPLVFLYYGNYDMLYKGLLGWNLAANAHLPANPKLTPFFNDIFWASPVLWTVGGVAAIGALRNVRSGNLGEKSKILAVVAGLIVLFVLVFNILLSRQTFGQYYLQAIPALVLLAAWGLDALLSRPLPKVARYFMVLGIVYLGVLNPLMNVLTPWTPDLEEKLSIGRWLEEEVDAGEIWEPWVYYAYLAEKDFTFYYPFLSIHSMQDDSALPTIDGTGFIPLEEHLKDNAIQWVVVHQPMLLSLQSRLDRIFKAGPDDWQAVKSFRVTRYASEAGMQNHLWTPWWKPEVFYEEVTVWRKHAISRQGGLVGELTIRNPVVYPYLTLEVQHPGGAELYLLDESSMQGQVYKLSWHQTGHAFYLSSDLRLIGRQNVASGASEPLVMTISFAAGESSRNKELYQVRFLRDSTGDICPECMETWLCQYWEDDQGACEPTVGQDVIKVRARAYEPLKQGSP